MATRKKSRSSDRLKNRPGTNKTAGRTNRSGDTTESVVSKSSSRSTISGSTHPGGRAGDALAIKFDSTQNLAGEMPYNLNKALEHGELSMQPQEGQRNSPSDPSATGSTLTETNSSDKTGDGKPRLGSNPSNLPLDRVRVDSSGQTLTTNQGVPIADNQNSLKAGFRGPALLQDFILVENAGVPLTLSTGEPDPGVLIFPDESVTEALGKFVEAIATHRHFAREMDPPAV